MDARKFFLVSLGILCLVAAYQLGATRARADWSGIGPVFGMAGGIVAWNSQGQAYQGNSTIGSWSHLDRLDLPVPASDVKMLEGEPYGSIMFVTQSDEIWQNASGQWARLPPVPGGLVSVEGRSFGATKAKFRR